ncbi:MAG: selenocysteine-specific translation elongation factor [Alphaproteobacteria bacterium]
MIIATAGHIDHGKTLLVKALTGVDADRLPEEKKRGLTIDLGFAYTPAHDGSVLGFVDVPGHEKFVRNMIAGVTGIDCALLVVAADDGPMPQTEEHLSILGLLGVASMVVAITKIDRVSPARVAEVRVEIEQLLAGSGFEGAEIYPVSAPTCDGVPALRDALDRAAMRPMGAENGNFRLAVDRSFTVPGAGVVVTGAVFSGAVKIGDPLMVSPSGIPVRVRGIHAQNQQSETAQLGQRCALNITGQQLERGDINRGDWILAAPVHAPTNRIDARLRVLPADDTPIKHWTPVHLHLGAADIPARVAVLEGGSIAPGDEGLVQIVADRDISALRGDRFIVRDQSAWRTMAGGVVIDPFAPARGRARPERLSILRCMECEPIEQALSSLLQKNSGGVDLDWVARVWNLTPKDAAALIDQSVPKKVGNHGFSGEHWKGWVTKINAALQTFHANNKDAQGIAIAGLHKLVGRALPKDAVAQMIDELSKNGTVLVKDAMVRLVEHRAQLAPKDEALWKKLEPIFEACDPRPPSLGDMADEAGADIKAVEQFLIRASRIGKVVQVSAKCFFQSGTLEKLGAMAEAIAKADGSLTIKAFRDQSGLGRNAIIEVAEYFDRIGFTVRRGNERDIRKPATDVNWQGKR